MIDSTQGHKPTTLHLTAKINSCEYVIGTLSFKLKEKEEELSYHLHHPAESNHQPLNLNTQQPTSRADHVTWHNNVIHIKMVDKSTVLEIPSSYGSFLPTTPIVQPIFVESFFLNGSPKHEILVPRKSFTPWQNSHEQLIINSEKITDFSIALILIPSTTPIDHLFATSQVTRSGNNAIDLIYLLEAGYTPGRIEAYADWDILVITTPFVDNNTLRTEQPIPKFSIRALNYENPTGGLYAILLHASNHANKLTQQNHQHREIGK